MKFEIMRFSGVHLSNKINKLINLGMMFSEEDIIHSSGVIFLFTIPMGAN